MPQFFLPPADRRDKLFQLRGPEAYHIVKVLRCRVGQDIELFDGQGARYTGVIKVLHPDGSVEGELTATLVNAHPGPKVCLNLYQGLLKASRWEWVLEKGTEVGVSCFIPVTTARTVVLLREEERIQSKVERWEKIVLSAAKQCGRSDLPTLQSPVALRDALQLAKETGPILFAWEDMIGSSARMTVREALHAALRDAADTVTVNLFIGPEGGFEDEEVDLAEVHDAVLFALGPHALRSETAAIAATSLILYELGAL